MHLIPNRANFNAGMCKKLGIGTEADPAQARAFFRAGTERMDARCAVELAEYHLEEAQFPHASPATGDSSLHDEMPTDFVLGGARARKTPLQH